MLAENPIEVAPRERNPHGLRKGQSLVLEKSQSNDKYGTGSLVTRKGSAAFERRRGCLYKLVRANGPGKRAGRKRAAVGADALSQELDPGALRRARADLLAGRNARSAPGRPHRAHRDALRGAGKGDRGSRSTAPGTFRWSHRTRRIAGDRDRAGVGKPRCAGRLAARSAPDLRKFRDWPFQHAGPRRGPPRWRKGGAATP